MRRVKVDELSIVDGRLACTDKRSGQAIKLSDINTSLYLPSPEDPATLKGSLVWNGSTFNLEAEVGAPLALAEKKSSEVTAEISGDFGTATVSGTIAADPLSGKLRVGASGDSLGAALKAFGLGALQKGSAPMRSRPRPILRRSSFLFRTCPPRLPEAS
ncbi:hypothetical protein [Breoghania sp.]|uniref:hypothetical protein n=1 Tax=Breoghania sp. TaxID=2065378 RepID=UPI00261B9F6E|nr:hypothetical protein [Breoghania sp.]MDJ0932623.1 hypothetical protein [Breoghania sp.]